MAALLDSADIEHFRHQSNFYRTALVYCSSPSKLKYNSKYHFWKQAKNKHMTLYSILQNLTLNHYIYSNSNLRWFCFGIISWLPLYHLLLIFKITLIHLVYQHSKSKKCFKGEKYSFPRWLCLKNNKMYHCTFRFLISKISEYKNIYKVV